MYWTIRCTPTKKAPRVKTTEALILLARLVRIERATNVLEVWLNTLVYVLL